jgi:hypothetical protein
MVDENQAFTLNPYSQESMSSIKRDVKKKILPRPEVEKIFGLEIPPTVDPLQREVGSGG